MPRSLFDDTYVSYWEYECDIALEYRRKIQKYRKDKANPHEKGVQVL
jgi:hypothetical protein